MKKWTIALSGFLFVAVFLIHGKIFAGQAASMEEVSAEASKTLAVDNKNLLKNTVPVDEELEDEDAIDTDA